MEDDCEICGYRTLNEMKMRLNMREQAFGIITKMLMLREKRAELIA